MQVLHLILYQLAGQPYNDAELDFLAVDEQLVDIGDDLCAPLNTLCHPVVKCSLVPHDRRDSACGCR